jgi:hypothetical protein
LKTELFIWGILIALVIALIVVVFLPTQSVLVKKIGFVNESYTVEENAEMPAIIKTISNANKTSCAQYPYNTADVTIGDADKYDFYNEVINRRDPNNCIITNNTAKRSKSLLIQNFANVTLTYQVFVEFYPIDNCGTKENEIEEDELRIIPYANYTLSPGEVYSDFLLYEKVHLLSVYVPQEYKAFNFVPGVPVRCSITEQNITTPSKTNIIVKQNVTKTRIVQKEIETTEKISIIRKLFN